MRKLMWFSVGFGIACGIFAYCGAWMLCAAVLALATLIISVVLAPGKRLFRIVAIVTLGACIGCAWCAIFQNLRLHIPLSVDDEIQNLTAIAVDYSESSEYSSWVEAELSLDGRTYPAILYLYDRVEIKPGDCINGSFRLRCTANHEPTYHRGSGVFLLGFSQGDFSISTTQKLSMRYWPAVVRRSVLSRIDLCFPADTTAFCKALLLGERTNLAYDTDITFQRSGISHIVAVSGLHISMLMAGFFLLFGRGNAFFATPLLLLFSAMAGFTPSITRALLMQVLLLISGMVKRQYDPPTALACAALCMLAVNPLVITSVGFQLSVGSVAGIFLFSKALYRRLCGLLFWSGRRGRSPLGVVRNWFCSSVAVSLGAISLTTPLIALYFGSVSILSVITNLLVLLPVNIVFCSVAVICLLSFVFPWATGALGWCVGWLIRGILWISRTISDLPLAAMYTQSGFVVAWLVFAYLLFVIFLLDRKRQTRILFCCVTLALCSCLALSWIVPRCKSVEMTVLDVGQGQCVLISTQGRNFLIDCGGDYDEDAADTAYAALQSRGVFRLDGLVVTHYDRDHAGGVPLLLSIMPVQHVFLPDTQDQASLRGQIEMQSYGSFHCVNEDTLLQWEGGQMSIFAPVLSQSDNESGISVLFQTENCDILITGDLSALGESVLLSEKNIPQLDALVVGHHGSGHSTGMKLLDATRPQYAFISVAADNSYGHPNDNVLQRLNQYGCKVYRTDHHGTITFRR